MSITTNHGKIDTNLSPRKKADVANAADVERLFREAVGTFRGINVVVNCAGIAAAFTY